MANTLTYNNAQMKIITPLTQRGTIFGVLNNNWVMKKDEGSNPENPDNLDNPDTPPTNPNDAGNGGESGGDDF